jgi:hypothetical protein
LARRQFRLRILGVMNLPEPPVPLSVSATSNFSLRNVLVGGLHVLIESRPLANEWYLLPESRTLRVLTANETKAKKYMYVRFYGHSLIHSINVPNTSKDEIQIGLHPLFLFPICLNRMNRHSSEFDTEKVRV